MVFTDYAQGIPPEKREGWFNRFMESSEKKEECCWIAKIILMISERAKDLNNPLSLLLLVKEMTYPPEIESNVLISSLETILRIEFEEKELRNGLTKIAKGHNIGFGPLARLKRDWFKNFQSFSLEDFIPFYTNRSQLGTSYVRSTSSEKVKVDPTSTNSKVNNIALMGFEKSGKNSLLQRFLLQRSYTSLFTAEGFKKSEITFLGSQFNVFDLGIQMSSHIFSESIFSQQDAIIFTIDSTDMKRLTQVRLALNKTISAVKPNTPIMILATKQDRPDAMAAPDLIETLSLNLESRIRKLKVFPVSVKTGSGIYDAFIWLCSALNIVPEHQQKVYRFDFLLSSCHVLKEFYGSYEILINMEGISPAIIKPKGAQLDSPNHFAILIPPYMDLQSWIKDFKGK